MIQWISYKPCANWGYASRKAAYPQSAVMTDICVHCKKTYSLDLLIRQHVTKSGKQRYYCRPCTRERAARYRDAHRTQCNKTAAAYQRRTREKMRARDRVRYALDRGYIQKPELCTFCKLPLRLEAHHKDYNKPLEVLWLCRSCHADVHRSLRDKQKRLLES
jgi:hypothetical protein